MLQSSTEEKTVSEEESSYSVTVLHSVTEGLDPVRELLRSSVDFEHVARRLVDTAAARPWQRGLFSFLRELRGLLDPEDAFRAMMFRPVLTLWWKMADVPELLLDDLLARAVDQWRKIEHPASSDVLAEARAAATTEILPVELDDCDQISRDIAALCMALADHPKNVQRDIFFLSARTAAAHAGTDAMTANRRLRLLQDLSLMGLMEPGCPGHAARYRWLANPRRCPEFL